MAHSPGRSIWYILALGGRWPPFMWRLWALCWLYMDIWSHSLAVVGARPRVARPASGGPGGRVPIPLMLSVWIGFSSSICWKGQYDIKCTG